ncbi:hypothetical protein BU14_0461s0001 [Porphyra umbilicalis]|uniref:DUF1995 domain-containing protein n=1 Tax=Porphyra umbilicalis TaxID=2786 RepID=A0A1X6NU61_PORUM|nr:hypothetical protein BU14_0461s0001 [Porphyra umbilicalis]|eukprot:OSX72159.1 hypothetical protein BU14_0461s0001 [Porphyra umbilicalis]
MRGERRAYQLVKTYLQPFANVYWALALAPALLDRGDGGGAGGAGGGGTLHAISTDSVVKERAVAAAAAAGVRLSSLRSRAALAVGPADAVAVLDPRATDTWRTAAALVPAALPTTPLVALNASFTETYGLGGPLPDVFEPAFYLKRVSKGWVLREYPGPWQVWLETPPTAAAPGGGWSSSKRRPPSRGWGMCLSSSGGSASTALASLMTGGRRALGGASEGGGGGRGASCRP